MCTPSWVKASCNLLTMGINCSMPMLPAIVRTTNAAAAAVEVHGRVRPGPQSSGHGWPLMFWRRRTSSPQQTRTRKFDRDAAAAATTTAITTTTTTAITTTAATALARTHTRTPSNGQYVTTNGGSNETYGRKRSFVRIQMIVRSARVRTACVCVCTLIVYGYIRVHMYKRLVCVCFLCVSTTATIRVGAAAAATISQTLRRRSHSIGIRQMTPTVYERAREDGLQVDGPLFGGARIQMKPAHTSVRRKKKFDDNTFAVFRPIGCTTVVSGKPFGRA